MMTSKDEIVKDPCQEMARLAQTFLPLIKWGFKEGLRFETTSPKIIYDSELCRIKFIWNGWDNQNGNTMTILYGRSHALNDKYQMIFNEEECYCWHRVELALHFLDRRTPEYTAQNIYSHDLKKKFRQLDLELNLTGERNQTEWLVRMHAMIWENYAPRLFEVFDLRNPEFWKQYRQFVKQVYEIKGHNPDIDPPLDHIC